MKNELPDNPSEFAALTHLPLHKGGFSAGKSYVSIVDAEKTAFEQRGKHRQNGHKKSATSILAAFADMGG